MGILGKKNKEVGKVVLVPLENITSNPGQPRKYFDQNALTELCHSINSNGLLQPVSLRRIGEEQYELIAGERRTMAYRMLGRDTIPAIVEEYTPEQSAVLALVENLQRRDLNYFEEAAGIARLMREQGLTQAQISQRLGKAQSTIANKLRLLRYPTSLQEKMLQAQLTERHARALLRVPEEHPLEDVVSYVIKNHLNVEQTERYIERLHEEQETPVRNKIFVVKDIRLFLNTINRAVNTMRSSGIDVDMDRQERDGYLEYTLRVPVASAYRVQGESETKTG